MQETLTTTIIGGGTAGLITFLLCALVAVLKGWWVPGYLYRAQETKLSRYEEIAYKAVAVAERTTGKEGTP